jgi:NADH dehydrogenase [ubiquinone] 1 alpha subcomplex assembly factor 1
MILFDFNNEAECNSWHEINDVVMGGMSRSKFESVGAGIAVFSGNVSLKNSGGFASVRSVPSLYDLREYKGLKLLVRGDGKQYKMNLKTQQTFDGILYQAVFEPKRDEWDEILIPFSSFLPVFRGVLAQHAPSLDTASICSFGFLISNRQEGRFRMEIRRIGVFP